MWNPWQRLGLVTLAAVIVFCSDGFLWDGSLMPLAVLGGGCLSLAYGCQRALQSDTSPRWYRYTNYAGIILGLALALVLVLLVGSMLWTLAS